MSHTLDYACPIKKSERPFSYPDTLILTAGPCTVSPRVLKAISEPVVYVYQRDSTFQDVSKIILLFNFYLHVRMIKFL